MAAITLTRLQAGLEKLSDPTANFKHGAFLGLLALLVGLAMEPRAWGGQSARQLLLLPSGKVVLPSGQTVENQVAPSNFAPVA